METFKTQVISNGRISIPSKIRKKLTIEEGDYVKVNIEKLVLVEDNPQEAS
jgi:AbrB family looped-hinge helix DNA binding protein